MKNASLFVDRRHFFKASSTCIGCAAFASLINQAPAAANSITTEGLPHGRHFAPKAKRIIYL
ncbi:MAG: sulfatase, partial [Planctomycetota bacterium]